MKAVLTLFLGVLAVVATAIKVGDTVPKDVELHLHFPPQKVSVGELLGGKKAILAWAEDQGVPEDGIITLYGDPYAELTEALGMELDHSGPKSLGLVNRCKRHALFVDNGVVKLIRVAEREDDPAGDDFPDDTLAEAMIEAISALEKNDEL